MAEGPSRARLRIAVSVPCRAWLRRVPDARSRCRRLARAALAAGGFELARAVGNRTAELSLVLGDDALLRRLNRDFRGKDKPTNVLSFPALDPAQHGERAHGAVRKSTREAPPVAAVGDVAIAYETTAYEAREQGKTLAAHLSHLVVHGVLHLLGYDHLSKDQAKEMETLETAVLAQFGMSDPYRAVTPRSRRRAASRPHRITHARHRAVQPRT